VNFINDEHVLFWEYLKDKYHTQMILKVFSFELVWLMIKEPL